MVRSWLPGQLFYIPRSLSFTIDQMAFILVLGSCRSRSPRSRLANVPVHPRSRAANWPVNLRSPRALVRGSFCSPHASFMARSARHKPHSRQPQALFSIPASHWTDFRKSWLPISSSSLVQVFSFRHRSGLPIVAFPLVLGLPTCPFTLVLGCNPCRSPSF